MPKHKTVFEDCDVLVVGGGISARVLAGCVGWFLVRLYV